MEQCQDSSFHEETIVGIFENVPEFVNYAQCTVKKHSGDMNCRKHNNYNFKIYF